jgi:hypothetical protein
VWAELGVIPAQQFMPANFFTSSLDLDRRMEDKFLAKEGRSHADRQSPRQQTHMLDTE